MGQLDALGVARPDNEGVADMGRKESIASMRDVLLTRRDALRKALAGDLSTLKELKEQTAGDVVDAALDSVQDELSSQLAEVESRELASIENALEQIRQGSYGHCEACNASIPLARLQALPYATLCIDCQRKVEELGGSASSPGDWAHLLDIDSNDVVGDVEVS